MVVMTFLGSNTRAGPSLTSSEPNVLLGLRLVFDVRLNLRGIILLQW